MTFLIALALAAPAPTFPSRTVNLVEKGAGVLAPSRAVYDAERQCSYIIGGVWDGQLMRLDHRTGALKEIFRKDGFVVVKECLVRCISPVVLSTCS